MTDESKIVATLKAGAGYEAPWLVIHGNTVDEVDETLDQVAKILAKVRTTAAAFAAARPDAAAAEIQGQLGGVAREVQGGPFDGPPASGFQPQQAAPAAPPQAPAGPFAPAAGSSGDPKAWCADHNSPRTLRQGVSKKGFPYKRYDCSVRGCPAVWG